METLAVLLSSTRMSSEPANDSGAQLILDADAVTRELRRMAAEIVERNAADGHLGRLALVGIYTRGVEVARRLADEIETLCGTRPAEGALDVSMHRDDLRLRARLTSIQTTRLPLDLGSSTVVLVDDVFFTGRTVRAALDSLVKYGRPPCIQLAVLVDRGHRELPIRPDYVGQELATSASERIMVRFAALDNQPDAVWLDKGAKSGG